MPGDAKECREHALRCAELAATARTPQSRAMFFELSKDWEKLAVQRTDAFATITDETMFQESLNLTKWLSSLPIWKRQS
jgi:hypothetical protein